MDKSGKFVVRTFPGIPTDDICDQERPVDCRHYTTKRKRQFPISNPSKFNGSLNGLMNWLE